MQNRVELTHCRVRSSPMIRDLRHSRFRAPSLVAARRIGRRISWDWEFFAVVVVLAVVVMVVKVVVVGVTIEKKASSNQSIKSINQ